jgi:hypothetical protein
LRVAGLFFTGVGEVIRIVQDQDIENIQVGGADEPAWSG